MSQIFTQATARNMIALAFAFALGEVLLLMMRGPGSAVGERIAAGWRRIVLGAFAGAGIGMGLGIAGVKVV